MTAVELKQIDKHGKKETLESLYRFEKDEFTKLSNHSYEFPENTNSLIQWNDKQYTPTKLYLTPKLHSGKHSHELVVELVHQGEQKKNEKLFLCFTLSPSVDGYMHKVDGLTFPMKTCPLEIFIQKYGTPHLFYTTGNRDYVIVCTTPIYIDNDFPTTSSSAKKVYKEIFEPHNYDFISSIFTLQDSNPRVIEAGANVVQFRKQLFSTVEGFKGGDKGTEPDGDYMECEVLNDQDAPMAEYIITPMKEKVDSNLFAIFFFLFLLFGIVFLPMITLHFCEDLIKNGKTLDLPHNAIHIILLVGFCFTFILTCVFAGMKNNKKHKSDSKRKKIKRQYVDVCITFMVIFGLLLGDSIGLLIRSFSSEGKINLNIEKPLDWLSFFAWNPYSYINKKSDSTNNTSNRPSSQSSTANTLSISSIPTNTANPINAIKNNFSLLFK
jgi:hypothetical protein